jgi:hypothetical protein
LPSTPYSSRVSAVSRLVNGELHPRGQLVAADAAFQRVVAGALGQVPAIELRQRREAGRLRGFVELAGRDEIAHRRAAGLQRYALMPRRQKAARPVRRAARGQRTAVGQHDERGQVVDLAAQSVRHPRAGGRKTQRAKAAVGLVRGRRVVAGARPHRADDGQLVGPFRQVRKQVRNPQSAFAALLELEVRLVQQPHLAHEGHRLLVAGHGFAVQLFEARLVVERIDLAEPALQEDLNRPLRFGGMMRRRIGGLAGNCGGLHLARQERSQRHAAQAGGEVTEQLTS